MNGVQPETARALPARLLTDGDLADMFGVNVLTVRKWVKAGKIPAPAVVGARRYWRPEAIAQLLDAPSAAGGLPAGVPDPGQPEPEAGTTLRDHPDH